MERQQDGPTARSALVRRAIPRPATRAPFPQQLLFTQRRDGAARPETILQLQRACGNYQVQRLLAPYTVSRQLESAPAGASQAATGPVVDDSSEPGPGQMRRSAFLATLRAEVEAELSAADPVARADARAQLPAVFADLQRRDARSLERSLRQNVPGVEGSDATSYIRAATAVFRARLAGSSAGGRVRTGAAGVVGQLLSAVGGLASALFKAREGTASHQDARVVRGQLGAGQPLDSTVRPHLESAYGQDFSGVRVHTDAGSSELSNRLDARAFTVGSDIAFAAGEYRPGTLTGDALIAHELAHVAQQDRGRASRSVPDLEEEADRSAVSAMTSQWVGTTGQPPASAMPRLRAGLRLQRCATTTAQQRGGAQPGQACTTFTPEQWGEAVTAAKALPVGEGAAAMTRLAQQAVCDIGIAVQAASTAHPDAVHPDDYAEVPVVNFDARLNQKTRWRGEGRTGPPVGNNVGYNFTTGSRRFAIIGPNSLDPNTLLDTRMYAQHELRLVNMDQPSGRSDYDLELQSWTENFRNYFHQYLRDLPSGPRPRWTPLIGYYERAAPEVRQAALRRLVDYYNNPPVAADEADEFRSKYRLWMSKEDGALITDLDAALPSASP